MIYILTDRLEFRGTSELALKHWALRLGTTEQAIERTLWKLYLRERRKENNATVDPASVNQQSPQYKV